jgi:hypothetical protein
MQVGSGYNHESVMTLSINVHSQVGVITVVVVCDVEMDEEVGLVCVFV